MGSIRKEAPPEGGTTNSRGRWRLGLVRAMLLGGIVWLIGVAGRRTDGADPAAGFTAGEIRGWISEAESLGEVEGDGGRAVVDAGGEEIGRVFVTRPVSEAIIGYSGPTHLLVVCGADGRCLGVRILESGDTWSHRRMVEDDEGFLRQWEGLRPTEYPLPGSVDVVSGASLTSEAIARSLRARFSGEDLTTPFGREFPLAALAEVLPGAARVEPVAERRESFSVLDAEGGMLAVVLRTGNRAGAVRGFNGPQDLLIVLDRAGERVRRVLLAASRDNQPYVRHVGEEIGWTEFMVDREIDGWLEAAVDPASELVVSGASVTAEAVVEQVREALEEWRLPAVREPWLEWKVRDSVLVAWVGLALLIGWSGWRGDRRLRLVAQVAGVAVGGIWLGVMIGQGLFVGWSRSGVPWRTAPALVLLTAAAVILPLVTGRNGYCERVCPHGLAQGLAFRLLRWRWVPSNRWHRWLRRLPALLLVVVIVLAVAGWRGDIAGFEPFDVWSAGWYALVPVVIWVLGLALSVFVPQGYCHYGCPTGELLRFLGGSGGKWSRRDTAAVILVLVSGVIVVLGR